jgi:hypothetical protein
VRAVAGGFLTSKEKLRFFVEGKSGSCTGIPGCKPSLGAFDGNTSTGTATMRRDGFASIAPASSASGGSGVLTTEPMAFGGGSERAESFLFVNVAAKAGGSLQVELLTDGARKLLSTTIHGHTDSTKLMVRWQQGNTAAGNGRVGNGTASSSLGHWPLPSTKPQLRFTLTGSVELFSFWLTHDSKCGRSNGPVAGGGSGFDKGWDRIDGRACALG